MNEHSKEAVIKVLGIDLAKRSFHLHGVDGDGRQVLSKKLTRARLSEFVCSPYGCDSSGWKSRPGSCLFTQVVITDSWEGDRTWASSVVKVPGAWRKHRWSSRWGEQLCRP